MRAPLSAVKTPEHDLPRNSGPLAFNNPQRVQAQNPLIGHSMDETLDLCTSVIAVIRELHGSNAGTSEEIESGQFHILGIVMDALTKQSEAIQNRRLESL